MADPIVVNLSREDLVLRTYFSDAGIANKMTPLLDTTLYEDPSNKELVKIIRQFIKKYNRRPTAQEIVTGLAAIGVDNIREKLMFICNTSVAYMHPDFCIDMLETFYREKKFEQILLKQAESLHEKRLDTVRNLIPDVKNALNFSLHMNLGLNVRDDAEEAMRRLRQTMECIPSGLTEINMYTSQSADMDELGNPIYLATGGYHRKTLTLFVGQPNVGKSLCLCSEAVNAARSGFNVLYITFELAEEYVWRRLVANWTDVPQGKILDLTPDECRNIILQSKNDGVDKAGELNVIYMPTTSTPDEISVRLDEFLSTYGVPVDLLVLDYIGIMKSNHHRMMSNSYEEGVEKAEQIRGICIERNIAGLSAVQFGRSGYKRLDAGMESVADSAGYNNTADLMITLTSDQLLRECGMFSNTFIKNRFGPNEIGFISKNDFGRMRWYSVTSSDYEAYETRRAEQAVTEAVQNNQQGRPGQPQQPQVANTSGNAVVRNQKKQEAAPVQDSKLGAGDVPPPKSKFA